MPVSLRKFVNIDSLKCRFGFHKPNEDWCLKWSSKVYYCNCRQCGKFLVQGKRRAYSERDFYRIY